MMSAFRVGVVAVNPKNEKIVTGPITALVDTGSELTWLPAPELTGIGITPRRRRTFITATGERLQREIGYAIVRAEGYETTDEVVFGRQGDQVLLGVRTLEGFAVTVDPIGHRLVAQATLACVISRSLELGSGRTQPWIRDGGAVPVADRSMP